MAHVAQKQFCESVKARFPEFFKNVKVLDVGSMDINGNNRYLFEGGKYFGLDIGPGPNVDIVKPVHIFEKELNPKIAKVTGLVEKFDVVISCEMLEHDQYFNESVTAMVNLVRKGGLLIITAAGEDRPEHGTTANLPDNSPHTNNYYQNIIEKQLAKALSVKKSFTDWDIICNAIDKDIYFWGIKK